MNRALVHLAEEPSIPSVTTVDLPDPEVVVALERLPERDREILRLSAWDGLDVQGIAVVLGITPSGVSSRLHRARRRLAEQLTPVRSKRTGSAEDGI